MPAMSVPFSVNVVGDATGQQFRGDFEAKVRLSFRDEIERDKIRRAIIGPDPDNAGPRTKNQAFIVADLQVRLTKTSPWWQSANGGLDLEDDNVLLAIFEAATKIEKDAADEIKKKAEVAEKELRKLAEEDTVG